MKKKRVKEPAVTNPVIRIANDRDIERLNEFRSLEHNAMVRARAIAATLGLDMKICDVEYRGDGRKATFFYTADGRVDFRELVRLYAKEFHVKIEMRQIGARQESARIGGIGSCGRELCCSTWLTDFKSVNTHAARYQNLSINQAKLSGQCGRLKCCLNYELDTYMEALEEFPQDVDVLKYKGGNASMIKIDIFKRLVYYMIDGDRGRGVMVALPVDRVKYIRELNQKGQYPDELIDPTTLVDEEIMDFADVTGEIELPDIKKKRKKKRSKPGGDQRQGRRQEGRNRNKEAEAKVEDKAKAEAKAKERNQQGGQHKKKRYRPNKNRGNRGDQGQQPPKNS